LSELGQHDEGIKKLEAVLKFNPYQVNAYVDWGQILRRQGKLDAAVSKFKRATEINPRESWAWQNWGSLLLELHDDEAAIDKLGKIVQFKPWRPSSWKLFLYLRWSVELWKQEQHDEAVQILERARRIKPTDVRLKEFLAAYRGRQRLERGSTGGKGR
jgi:tetratricopeptide (TPR) repeat protein